MLRTPRFADIRVGVILDEFSFAAFEPEWTLVPLERSSWRSQLDGLDAVFVESAWNGNGGQWAGMLTSATGPKDEFTELVRACRTAGIPNAFWNKEDPPHFADFLPAAALFDVVFTSDSRLIPEYSSRLEHARVFALPFAAQPAIHSPARPQGPRAESGVAFAGMYFAHKYPERREQMKWLLGAAADAAAKSGERFEIFSRQHGGEERYAFPEPLAKHVVGSIPYSNMLTAYKDFKVFLNVNSVTDSPSMCARRIFEIIASGTPVVTAPSAATREFFPLDELAQPENRDDATAAIRALLNSEELRDRTVHKAQRRIWGSHTYTHRARSVMATLGISAGAGDSNSISALAVTNRPHQLHHLLQSLASQTVDDLQTVLITHGFRVSDEELRASCLEAGLDFSTVVYEEAPASSSLGECLNTAITRADGDVLAKWDDDDVYGENYLLDQMNALSYSGADLVGKQAHYMHLADSDVLLLRFPDREHKYTDFVMGPTMLGRAAAFRDIGFADLARGEDTDFQRRLTAEGGSIYSADRFNFVQSRQGSAAHTWKVSDEALMATGRVHSFGFPRGHVIF